MNRFSCRGMTLIEIMVSVMILLITITGLMTTYTYLNKQADKMQQKRFALRFAQKKLEEWMADPDCLKASEDYKQQNFISTLTTKPLQSGCQKVECNVSWIDGNVSLTTIWGN